MDQLHQDRLQVAEGGSGLHAEAQLLLKVPPEGHLGREKVTEPSDLGVTDAAETFPRSHRPQEADDQQSQRSFLVLQSQSAGEQRRAADTSEELKPPERPRPNQTTDLTESCMVLQMCSMALRMTGSLVSSS